MWLEPWSILPNSISPSSGTTVFSKTLCESKASISVLKSVKMCCRVKWTCITEKL